VSAAAPTRRIAAQRASPGSFHDTGWPCGGTATPPRRFPTDEAGTALLSLTVRTRMDERQRGN